MADVLREKKRKVKGTGDYVFAAVINVIGLVVINTWPLWLPLTKGVVTPEIAHTVWAGNLAAGVQLGGNLAMAFGRPPRMVRLMNLLFSLCGLISAGVFFQVFPLDFAQINLGWMNFLMRFVLIVAMFGTSIAVVVNLVQLFVGGGPRRTAAHP